MIRQRLLFAFVMLGLLAACTRPVPQETRSPTVVSPLTRTSPLVPGNTPKPSLVPVSPTPAPRLTPTIRTQLATRTRIYLPLVLLTKRVSSVPSTLIPKNLGGLHIEGGGDHTGYEELLRACAKANRPVGLIKVYGDGYSARLAKEADPRTITIYRKPSKVGHDDYEDNPPGDWTWPANETADRARRWMEGMYPDWNDNRQYIDYFEIVNEPNPATITQTLRAAEFMMEAMKLAEQYDPPYRLAIWSFSSGTPEPWQADKIAYTLKYAAEHGHILAIHDGSVDSERQLFRQAYEDGTAFRYRMFFSLLGKSMPRVAITEAYQPRGYLEPDWADWQWYLTELAKDDVIGAAWFTLGPYSFGGGTDVNVFRQLPDFADALGCR